MVNYDLTQADIKHYRWLLSLGKTTRLPDDSPSANLSHTKGNVW